MEEQHEEGTHAPSHGVHQEVRDHVGEGGEGGGGDGQAPHQWQGGQEGRSGDQGAQQVKQQHARPDQVPDTDHVDEHIGLEEDFLEDDD